ncbi:MAG TPA: cobaltochelatase subunit CobN [Devosia sp.]|nr:cobaltochelatase subunit CobN [Devosia sp.]
MHLLAAHAGALQQEGEAIDLEQSPGEIIFASAADSELSSLAGALDRAANIDMRLANTMRLSHNMSVDLWLEKTVCHAKLVVIRLLGGASYWQYGVDELCALAARTGQKLVLLPGEAIPDPDLIARSNIREKDWHYLHSLFTAGGPDNMDMFLQSCMDIVAERPIKSKPPSPFARFGYWWPGLGITDAQNLAKQHVDQDGINFVPLLFYRAALEGAGTATLEALIFALQNKGLKPVPLVISTLKEGACIRFTRSAFKQFPPGVILNLTGFALGLDGIRDKLNPFADTDAPILQLVQGGRAKELWQEDIQGLSAKDLAMQVVLPELDGKIGALIVGHKQEALWHEGAQCFLSAYAPDTQGIERVVRLADNWVRLKTQKPAQKKVAVILANYPIRDGRIANGVGYDAPASTLEILRALKGAGYGVRDLPANGNELIKKLQSGPTNAAPARGKGGAVLPLAHYEKLFAKLPEKVRNEVTARWGSPENDPFCRKNGFHLPLLDLGNIVVLLQPARGYERDEEASYHDPDLVPPHAYIAAYLWLTHVFGAHALIHNGKHGSLEWLPGKATALDENAYPNLLWGCLPHFYPFIVNDPGEGTQAKRRTGAVIIDHLVPPLTRAETYGPLKDLEALLDEYYAASGMDQRRLGALKKAILNFAKDNALDKDIQISADNDEESLGNIDNFLCELKEAQIRDGLHIFGQSPQGQLERDLLVALVRVPRGEGPANGSLIRALADDLHLGFDPLVARLGDKWEGPKPDILAELSDDIWRNMGDTVERLELLALNLVQGPANSPQYKNANPVLNEIAYRIRPKLAACGPGEIKALLEGLAGRFVQPGASGAPSRGRLDVLPTGRNFYSVDTRAVPTPTAWELGQKSAQNMILRHFQDHGTWLASIAMSAWGTANMRTGGDDIAQALALIGAKPKWDPGSLRVTDFEIIPLAKLGRPRVDVTLRISGFFRDAFPELITLFDRAIRAIGALDEPAGQNPIAATMRTDALELMEQGMSESEAALSVGHRIFGSRPGAYGAGLQGLMDSSNWKDEQDLAKAFLNWGQYAYGAKTKGAPQRDRFARRLMSIEAVVHNQDNREHDLLDSDDYYQFEGGLSVTARALSGEAPQNYHNDHSRPERPVTRTLEEEVSLVMRSRVVNPKWLNGVMRHGYKGAFEIIATLDYMFAFAATTGAVKTHHFDLAFAAFVENDEVREFIVQNNIHGYDELLAKFNEAIERGLWTPKTNSAHALLNEKGLTNE